MDRTRGTANLHQRLTVAWLDDDQRASVVAALGHDVRLVGRQTLEELAGPAAERRRERETVTDAVLEEELRALEARRTSAEVTLEGLVSEHRRLREAADWCELQPEDERVAAARISELVAEIDEHSRKARDATRQLERVVEQRAAAEAALEEARRELAGLGATGIDETDVRRQMEAASHELRSATSDYQDAMKDVARRRAELAELEDAAATTGAPAVPKLSDGDQLQAMSQALRAKFAPEATAPSARGEHDLERARTEVRAAQERADEAAHRLSAVRRTITGFETELAARTNDGDARSARHDAAIALETQVRSVERQLSEAEAAARSQMDDVTRSMSRAELALERLREEARDRRHELRDLVGLLPADQRPPADADLVGHACEMATALRELAAPMQGDIDHASEVFETVRRESEEKADALERRRRGRAGVLPEDRRAALQDLIDDVAVPVVLDDVVTVDEVLALDGGGLVPVNALEHLDISRPLVVLTGDSAVAGWAIELPGDRGRLANGAEMRSWAEGSEASVAAPARPDQQPEPSTSR